MKTLKTFSTLLPLLVVFAIGTEVLSDVSPSEQSKNGVTQDPDADLPSEIFHSCDRPLTDFAREAKTKKTALEDGHAYRKFSQQECKKTYREFCLNQAQKSESSTKQMCKSWDMAAKGVASFTSTDRETASFGKAISMLNKFSVDFIRCKSILPIPADKEAVKKSAREKFIRAQKTIIQRLLTR